jgi:hypothetical protein
MTCENQIGASSRRLLQCEESFPADRGLPAWAINFGYWNLRFSWDLDFGIWDFSGAWILVFGALTSLFDKRSATGIFSPARPEHRSVKRRSYAR